MSQDVPVIFITAPTSFYRLGVHPWLIRHHFAHSEEDASRLHREYNQAVREEGREVLDLEALCEELPDLERLMLADGIHFRAAGLRWVAERVAEAIEESMGSPDPVAEVPEPETVEPK